MSSTAAGKRGEELGNPGYELFIVGISLLSVIDFVAELLPLDSQTQVIARTMEVPFTLILLIDFARRLSRSHPRSHYFIRQLGWLDLLGCLPGLKVFRLFRVVRVVRQLRKYGGRSILRDLMRHRAENALYIILFLVVVLLQYGSTAVLAAERSDPNANIKTGGEALWWAFVSITTVGYGDYTPVTGLGRVIATLVLAAGVGLFGALSGFLANFFLSPAKEDLEPAGATRGLEPLAMLAELEAGLAAQGRAVAALRAALREIPRPEPAAGGE